MNRISVLFVLLIGLVLTGCHQNQKEDDNIFKFKEYIAFNTFGRVPATAPIKIELAKPATQFESDQKIPSEYLIVYPKTEGQLRLQNGTSLVFVPEEPLIPDTEYTITLKLSRFFEDLAPEYRNYTFSFKTITPNFKINLGDLQSYNEEWQYLTGSIETADLSTISAVKKLINANQEGKALKLDWPVDTAKASFFNFTIDSIHRKRENSQILIAWDGKAIGSKNQGQSTLNIPAQSRFTVVDVTTSLAPETSVSINFSDPLEMEQNFEGLVELDSLQNLRYEVQGNVLTVYPRQQLTGSVQLRLNKGIRNAYGSALREEASQQISFEQLKPQVRLISNGTILPASAKTPLYFEAVNLSAVDVRVIKVYQNNMLQYLQSASLSSTDSYELNRVGRRIAKKTIPLVDNSIAQNGLWRAYALDLSEFFKADPGALYRVEFSFEPSYSLYPCPDAASSDAQTKKEAYLEEAYEEYYDTKDNSDVREMQYWDNLRYSWRNRVYNWEEEDNPCHPAYYNEDRFAKTNVLGSDLGLIVKESENGNYDFATSNLITAEPEMGVEIRLYNYQQQLIKSLKTNLDGLATFKSDKSVAFAIAQQRNNFAYANLQDGNALSLSNFDISGTRLEKGLQGYIYTERGVHRPGDSIHLTFVLNDLANPLPAEHPVKLEVTDARGKLVLRNVISSSLSDKGMPGDRNHGFYYFPIATHKTDPTGNWTATVTVGGVKFTKRLRVATVKPNRLKIKLDFEDTYLTASKPVKGSISASWLHGAPARNLKADITATLRSTSADFPNFKNYTFTDPVRSFNEVEIPILEQQELNNDGKLDFTKKLKLSGKAPGMLQATFLTKVYEGGGDFSVDVFSKKLAPYTHFAGIHAPKTREYDSYSTDEEVKFDLASVTETGKPASGRVLQVQLFKIEWRWWFSRSSDNLSRYENTSVYKPVQNFDVTTNAKGKAVAKITVPEKESGRYLLRVIDKNSGHATGLTTYFFRNWNNLPAGEGDSAKMLVFSSDKETYQVGDEAVIKFPSQQDGKALLSIENGTQVLSKKWVDTEAQETLVRIPITRTMAPNVYVHISLLQPHAQTLNDRPIRLYGIIPLLVENPATRLEPKIQMPSELKPEELFKVKVSETSGKAMAYTLAVVDEGLLDITRFETPQIHNAFYARQALGVKTFDMYDEVIGAFSGSVDNIFAIGGGDMAAGAKNRKADRFKPVAKFLGPFYLEAGQTASHQIQMPNYIGSVRTMVVAGNTRTGAYGSAEATTPVRKPLMVLASIPRKLAPGEQLTLPVTVFAMDKKIKDVSVRVKTSKALSPKNGTTKTIRFAETGEQLVNFDFDVKRTDAVQKFEITATGNGERATYSVEIDVENPNPISQRTKHFTLEPNETLDVSYSSFGVKGTNTAVLEFSTLPQIDFTKRLQYLIGYPYGCAEQTTSSGFPQLYLNSIFELSSSQQKETQKNIKATINRLGMLQRPEGGVSYWPGERDADAWSTSYAGHFMLEAQKQGYTLPLTFLTNWLNYQKNAARQWRNGATSYNSSLTQAYRLYTLALAGQPELAAMNRLRESGELTNSSRWRLAAAYALAGKKQVANALAAKAGLNFNNRRELEYSYGSVLRNKAMALETMILLGDKRQQELAESITKDLSSGSWYSTQTTAFSLLSLSKLLIANGGKSIAVQAGQQQLNTEKGFITSELPAADNEQKVTIKNENANKVYVSLVQQGKLPLGEELAEQRNLSLKTIFVDNAGKILDPNRLRQGTSFKAKVTVTNTSLSTVDHIALAQYIPSGWEIVNTSFTALGGGASGKARYTDIRDDRVYFYFDLKSKESRTFEIDLNASFLGMYYLPGTQTEAMYDNDYFARTKGNWITVFQ